MSPWRGRFHAALTCMVLVTGGCALVVSFDDVTLGEPGAGGEGGGGGSGGGGGGIVVPEECTIFVAPDGEDDADGREVGRPLASLGRALDIASESGSSVEETVCVCGGTEEPDFYVEAEPLVIDRKTSLRGSYDCQTWQRPDFEAEEIGSGDLTTVLREAAPSARP